MKSSLTVTLARHLALKWIPGLRHGSEGRPAWKHAEDVANVVRQVPGLSSDPCAEQAEAIAWAHDLIEDGRKEDGSSVSAADLTSAGLPDDVVRGVVALSKVSGEPHVQYMGRVAAAPEIVRVVKCCDRIANLSEGSRCFSDPRWAKYVKETRESIMSHALGVRAPWRVWLTERLEHGMSLRPVL